MQFNPAYEQADSFKDIAQTGLLHSAMPEIFKGYSLYRHQLEAIRLGVAGTDFVVTSGADSGKSLTYIGSIFHRLLTEPKTGGGGTVWILHLLLPSSWGMGEAISGRNQTEFCSTRYLSSR